MPQITLYKMGKITDHFCRDMIRIKNTNTRRAEIMPSTQKARSSVVITIVKDVGQGYVYKDEYVFPDLNLIQCCSNSP